MMAFMPSFLPMIFCLIEAILTEDPYKKSPYKKRETRKSTNPEKFPKPQGHLKENFSSYEDE
jgi:hypothetical protein